MGTISGRTSADAVAAVVGGPRMHGARSIAIPNPSMAIQDRLSKLRRRFFRRPNAIQTRGGVAQAAFTSPDAHWIIGRDLCMYRCEDFGNVPKNRRRAALQLRLPVWSPFPNTGHHSVWSGDTAMVWLWDADQAAIDPTWLGESADNARAVPETVFYPRKADGIHVQACQEGFELQYWQADVLTNSFWTANEPDQARADWFAASLGHASARAGHVETTPAQLAEEPWASPVTAAEWVIANERRLVATGLTLFALAAVWQEARIWNAHWRNSAAEATLAAMQEDLGPVLNERNEYLGLRSRNVALGRILAEPSQAAVMKQVDAGIPNPQAQFQEWRYQQGDLKVVLSDPNADPVAYVRQLEAQPLLSGVAPGPSRRQGRVEFNMRAGTVE